MSFTTKCFRLFSVITLLLAPYLFAAPLQISDVTKNMLHVDGYFDFYYDKDTGKLLLNVDKEKKPFLFQSSLPSGLGSNDIGLDRGQLGDTRVVQFERHGNKVLLVQLNTEYRASSTNRAERKSVEEAFAKSVIQGFEIKAQTRGNLLIDYTDFLLSDIHSVATTLEARKQGSYRIDKSRSAVNFGGSKAFPKNTELESIVTFTGSKPGTYVKQIAPDPTALTVNLHHSLIELPDSKYTPRTFHPYSGFWSVSHTDYSAKLDDPLEVKYIPRHRLQKRYPNKPFSEAVEPIIYYLDPGTPEPVRTALLDGARWWNEAFKSAGFIDAFQVKMLPSYADPMDVRYNTIQWVHRATRGWSYGASVIDPRTGEIIKGHVTLGSLRVRQDYLIAQGLTAPFTKKNADTTAIKEMALNRIRQLSAHEIGHTLGIAHNFSASTNNRASVMDYPHPNIQLIDGKLDLSEAYTNEVGEWDHYVIRYGYSQFADQKQEDIKLAALVSETQQSGLLYMSDPDARSVSSADPAGHLWDNGSDPAIELQRMMEVRKFALEQFGLNNLAAGRPLSDLQEILIPVYLFHRYQTTAASKLIAGVDYHYEVKTESNTGTKVVAAEKQNFALGQLLQTIQLENLAIPNNILALIPPKAYGSYRNRESAPSGMGLVFDPISLASANIQHTLNALLHPERLNRVAYQYSISDGHWSLEHYLSTIIDATVKTLPADKKTALLHQRLTALTVEKLMSTLIEPSTSIEVKADVLDAVSNLSHWLSVSLVSKTTYSDPTLKLVQHHLNWYLEHRKWLPLIKPTALPPGSPI